MIVEDTAGQQELRRGKRHGKKGLYEKFAKRALDFLLSFFALIVLSPVFLIVSILIRIKIGSPVIFKQKRPGLHERIFTIYKFRTMTEKKDKNGVLFPDETRLTGFGKILRSTSMDELPELFNILRGDMSLVGPRPLLVQYLPLYSEHHKRRHEVRPGLSGLAQVKGRNSISWEEKLDFDVDYIEHITFLKDLKIIFLTIAKTLKREGISSETSATMEPFSGSGKNNSPGEHI